MIAGSWIAWLVGGLAALGGAVTWWVSARARWRQAGRDEARDQVAVAMVQRERELEDGERARYVEHMDRVEEIRQRAEELTRDTPAPSAVRALLERVRSRRRGLLLSAALAGAPGGDAMAQTETSSRGSTLDRYHLTTDLEHALWMAAVMEEARADEAESDARRLSGDLEACRNLPAGSQPTAEPPSVDWGLWAGSVWVAVVVGGLIGAAL